MNRRDPVDLSAGFLMMAVGLFIAIYAQRYNFGTPARMGPGFFPQTLGWVLVGLGIVIAVPAWFRSGRLPELHWRNMFFVVLALISFAVLLRPAGLVVTVFAASFIALLADNQSTWVSRMLTSAGVTSLAAAIFIGGLGMNLPLWPNSY